MCVPVNDTIFSSERFPTIKGVGGGRLLLSCHVWTQTCPLVCPSGRYLAPQGPKAKLPFFLHGLLKPPSPFEKYFFLSRGLEIGKPMPLSFYLILVPPMSASVPTPEVATTSSSPYGPSPLADW